MASDKFQVGPLYDHNYKARENIVVNQGGTRSGKTYSILQVLIVRALETTGKTYTIARKSFPALRLSVMRDFFAILESLGMYNESDRSKSENTYRLNGNLFEFVSLDDPTKKRGAKRDVLFMNEANEFTYEDWFQLEMRTTEQVYIDFNPSMLIHWIYSDVLTRPPEEVRFIQSNYECNPFLSQKQVNTIKNLAGKNENYWRIYGLGERGISQETIYPNVELVPLGSCPDDLAEVSRGMDFGYTADATVLLTTYMRPEDEWIVYVRLHLYKTGMKGPEIVREMEKLTEPPEKPERDRKWYEQPLSKTMTRVYGDGSHMMFIDDIYDAGWDIVSIDKPLVIDRIEFAQRYTIRLVMEEGSDVMSEEFSNYRFMRDKEGNMMNKPVKGNDHTCDAFGYALWGALRQDNAEVDISRL